MNKYGYVARSPTGKVVKGKINAENEEELKQIMFEKSFDLVKHRRLLLANISLFQQKIKKKDLIFFCQNTNMMLKAGISLNDSVRMVSEVTTNTKFSTLLKEVYQNLQKGKSLSKCLSEYGSIFPNFLITMIGIGEESGSIINVLDYIVQVYESQLNIQKKFFQALFYPCILLGLSILVLFILSNVIIPSFVNIFNEMHVSIPLITRIIIDIAWFNRKYGLFIILFLVIFIIFIGYYKTTKRGKPQIDYLLLKIPAFGKINLDMISSRFARCFAILTKSGLPVLPSLVTTSNLMTNEYVKTCLNQACNELQKGLSLADALDINKIFPSLLIKSLVIAEESNSLYETLFQMSVLYEEDARYKLEKFQTLIEPISIIVISIIVVIIIIAIFVPLFSVLNSISMG